MYVSLPAAVDTVAMVCTGMMGVGGAEDSASVLMGPGGPCLGGVRPLAARGAALPCTVLVVGH